MFYHCFRASKDICWVVKHDIQPSSTEIHVHVIDNSNNEIRGSGVERDAGRDEKQLIKFAWPHNAHCKNFYYIYTLQTFLLLPNCIILNNILFLTIGMWLTAQETHPMSSVLFTIGY